MPAQAVARRAYGNPAAHAVLTQKLRPRVG